MSIIYQDVKGNKFQMKKNPDVNVFNHTLLTQKPKGTLWYVVENGVSEENSEDEGERKMLDYAQENDLAPVGLGQLLQGDPVKVSDYIKLGLEERSVVVEKYFALEENIESLKAQKEARIKEIKEEYNTLISEKKSELAAIKTEARDGLREEKVDASWERLPEEEMMVRVRVDNLKPLSIRPMNGEEKTMNDAFDPDHTNSDNLPTFNDGEKDLVNDEKDRIDQNYKTDAVSQ